MFNRFSKTSRAAVNLAADEARALGDTQVRPEHILLGVIAHDTTAAKAVSIDYQELRSDVAKARHRREAAALETLGIDLDAVHEQVEEQFGTGALRGGSVRPGFSAPAKTALERSLEAARELRDKRLEPVHVLLGVLSVQDETVTRLLQSAGKTHEDIRAAVIAQRRAGEVN